YQFNGASQPELNIISVQTQSIQRHIRTTHNLAWSIIDNFNPLIISKKNVISGRYMLQRISICCEHCQAIHWPTESSTNCCRNGKVVLAPLDNAPPSILSLLTENSPMTGEPYLKQIWLFNSVFAFISIEASIDPHLANSANGVYTYRVQGAIYHRIGSMLPVENCTPKFLQIYIYDGNFEAELSYRHIFHSAGQFVREGQPVVLKILSGQGYDVWHYNCSTANEVAVLMIDDSTINSGRNILLRTNQGQLQQISECYAAYDALQYLLLFSYGQLGWHHNIPYSTSTRSNYHESHELASDNDSENGDSDNELRQTR
ncbi:2366_t:CDS:2, partial [Dentiscutata heterogama]